MDMTHVVQPGHQTVAIAAVELAEQTYHLFPKAMVKALPLSFLRVSAS